MTTRIALCLACSLALSAHAHAQDLQGAQRVIEATLQPGKDGPLTPESFATLRNDFIKASENLSPEVAAKGWLQLLDTWMRLSGYSDVDPFPALPVAEQWDVLAAEIDTRTAGKTDAKNGTLWLLAALLRNDDAEAKRRVESLRKSWAENDGALRYLAVFEEARWPLDAGTKLEQFRKSLKESGRNIRIPDLTGLPRQEAEELIFEALGKESDSTFDHDATRKIAAEAVLRDPKRLKAVAWGLIGGAADGPVIEAMLPADHVLARDDHNGRRGLASYFSYLVDTRAFDKADKIRKQFSDSENYYLTYNSSEGLSKSWRNNQRDYYLRVLREDPSQPFWLDLGRATDPDDGEVWDFFKTSLEENRVTKPAERRNARSEWLDHLFDVGREAEGMEYLGKCVAASTGDELREWLFKQVKAADLMGDKATADKANEQLESVVKTSEADSNFADLELERGRLAQLEKVAAEWLKHTPSDYDSNYQPATLVRVYDAAGRPDDVLAMLDGWAKWSGDDLSAVIRDGEFETGLCAARALVAKGRNAEAVDVLKDVIKVDPNRDAAYGLLLKLIPGECEGYLRDLAGKLPFQERPLIWLAQWYSDAGRLEEGEAAIRKAIAIDPSDGEMGKGDRMRAYRVLGEIQRKQGKTEEAEFMAKIDKAIRLSEDADDWWGAGMTRRAMVMYGQALEIFADAYCIQSRLALRYESVGDSENALKHYQRAFELMPDSFGRIESHCFGCEGAFRSATAQGVAERVFTALAANPDAKAQVFYLLGYLRSSQGREVEAVEYFRKAVEKDPDYVNALVKLADNAESAGLSPEESDRTRLKLLELTGSVQARQIHDLKRLWKALVEKERVSAWIKPKVPLYPLAATHKETLERAASEESSEEYESFYSGNYRQEISSHAVIRPILGLLRADE